ncbi:MAG: flavodoxin family protein [Lachnospiraceae bacterium]|nr:flavodoxin family protein [Lachnospiraceae bacterium]
MKILVLKSSGNTNGSSNMLADEFIRGAKEGGHEITEYDVIHKDIRPCLGCNTCGMSGPCVQKDDYENELKGLIKAADMLAFVMPVYYYNWPAQLKAVVDRFYSFTGELTQMHKKTVLLSVAWDNTDKAFEVVKAYYNRICEYMQFEDCGSVIGKGCGTPEMTRNSGYVGEAYRLGKTM